MKIIKASSLQPIETAQVEDQRNYESGVVYVSPYGIEPVLSTKESLEKESLQGSNMNKTLEQKLNELGPGRLR